MKFYFLKNTITFITYTYLNKAKVKETSKCGLFSKFKLDF